MTDRFAAWVYSSRLLPSFLVTLEVKGRRSGQIHSTAVVLAEHDGQRYLVSMYGESVDWVRNVRAAAGEAVLRHGRPQRVWLEEVPVDQRAPILKAYLKRAVGARPHLDVGRHAPIEDFERIAAKHLVFRIVSNDS